MVVDEGLEQPCVPLHATMEGEGCQVWLIPATCRRHLQAFNSFPLSSSLVSQTAPRAVEVMPYSGPTVIANSHSFFLSPPQGRWRIKAPEATVERFPEMSDATSDPMVLPLGEGKQRIAAGLSRSFLSFELGHRHTTLASP